MIYFKRLFFRLIGMDPSKMEMVQYWKKNAAVQAKLMVKDGVTVMKMEGEKYLFPGFPRGHLLFGKLSKLKHEMKNQIFNDVWAMLERKVPTSNINLHLKKTVFPAIHVIAHEQRYDMLPPYRMVPAVREIYRAWGVAGGSPEMRDILSYILQEDDSYRFRFQWMVPYMGIWDRWFNPVKALEKGLVWMENAEVIGDMKERVRLVRRVLLTILEDKDHRAFFIRFCREIKWRKVKLSKADKFFFRGKYYKVDLDWFSY